MSQQYGTSVNRAVWQKVMKTKSGDVFWLESRRNNKIACRIRADLFRKFDGYFQERLTTGIPFYVSLRNVFLDSRLWHNENGKMFNGFFPLETKEIIEKTEASAG